VIIDEILADLEAENDDLDRLVSGIGPDQWRLPTPAPRWTIAHQISHLESSAALATLAATDAAAFAARRAELGSDFNEGIEAGAAEFADGPPEQLLARWRDTRRSLQEALAAVPAGQRVPWIVTPVSPATLASVRLMELFGHGQDIADALGVERPATDRIAAVARLGVRTRDFAFLARGLAAPAGEFLVKLAAPGGAEWTWGPADAAQGVSGPAVDFCLLVTQRRHRDDLSLVASGPDADRWLDIAQAYAGPPGPGRAPGQFAAGRQAG
jgi:enediyne biosynthesis protein E11